MPASYDAFLLVSFGGPEGPDEVMPFLRNVTRGRNIPDERLEKVAEHYHHFGGVSPINQQNRDLIEAIEAEFAGSELHLPVYWGNRNWDPYLTDTVKRMAGDGIRRAVAFTTSAYSSYSSCRQYLEDIGRARAAAGPGAPAIDKLRHYFNHPGFVEPLAEHARTALGKLPEAVRHDAHLVFTAHSIPEAMAAASGPQEGSCMSYPAQFGEAARLISDQVDGGTHQWELAYQSRSGPPGQPWLEPDVVDHLAVLASGGARAAVLVPAGFTSDHMEVRYDLDVEAAAAAERLGIAVTRAAAPGTHPRFVTMIRELVAERISDSAQRLTLGTLGPSHDVCPAGCCAAR